MGLARRRADPRRDLGRPRDRGARAAARRFFFLGTCILGPVALRRYGGKDPQSVVSDEVAGYLVAVAFTADLALGFHGRVLAAFVLFRVFDIAKPWPCRQLEKLPGGLGIAADDAMAGVYAHLALRIGVFAWGAAVS